MFKVSEALHKVEGTKKNKNNVAPSWNSEVEKTWTSLIGWTHRVSSLEGGVLLGNQKGDTYTQKNFPFSNQGRRNAPYFGGPYVTND